MDKNRVLESCVKTEEKYLENRLAVSEFLLCTPSSGIIEGIVGEEQFCLMKLQKYHGFCSKEDSV